MIVSKNPRKWMPLADWLEAHMKKQQQHNEQVIDEASRPKPKESVN